MMIFNKMKPLLASNTDGISLTFPVLASPKLDGIRALVKDGAVVSRALKPIPNLYVQSLFGKEVFNGLDGELIVGEETNPHVFNITTSGVMTIEGEPDVKFRVFDNYLIESGFQERLKVISKIDSTGIEVVENMLISSSEELFAYEMTMLAKGYEGVMVRSLDGKYKFGRSTVKEGILLKLKRFSDSEAEILSVSPLMHNNNKATINNLGLKERSTKKAGKVALDMLGKIEVRDIHSGVVFSIGSGFTEEQRKDFWQKDMTGKIVKYKYQPAGVKDKPRFPTFLGIRHVDDI